MWCPGRLPSKATPAIPLLPVNQRRIDWIFKKIKIPALIGMLLIGIAFGPYTLGVIDNNLLAASADLRLIALIVILLRAGFELSKDTFPVSSPAANSNGWRWRAP
jgi:NhaP-type Na+/H+ and K+/H+ antiporter